MGSAEAAFELTKSTYYGALWLRKPTIIANNSF